MTLARVYLRNFKQFQDFGVSLRAVNILVGPNNSGKSTVLDAFRVLNSCLRYARTRNPILLTLEDSSVVAGYELPHSRLPIPIANISRDYSAEPAFAEFTGENGAK